MLKSEYPRPAYTADNLIILVPDDVDEYQKILLIKRSNDPFKDCWALPGGYVNLGETSEDAARREALEETGLKLPGLPQLVGVFDEPDRDPRGWVVSAAYAWFLPQLLLPQTEIFPETAFWAKVTVTEFKFGFEVMLAPVGNDHT